MVNYVYDNWGNVIEIDRLYEELPIRYELSTSSETVEIKEPVKWSDIQFLHKRDTETHGFNYELTGVDVDFSFDCAAGKKIIQDEYALNGNDGEVIVRRILDYDGTDIIEYEGRLNLNNMKVQGYLINCPAERKSLHQLIKSRIDAKLNLTESVDLDQAVMDPCKESFTFLRSRVLSQTFKSTKNVLEEVSRTESRTGASKAYFYFNISDPSVNTIETFFGNNLGVTADSSLTRFPIFQFINNGTYTFTIDLDFTAHVKINPQFLAGFRDIEFYYIDVYFDHRRGDDGEILLSHSSVTGPESDDPDTQNVQLPRITGTFTKTITVESGDTVYMYADFFYRHNANKLKSVVFNLQQYKCNVSVTGSAEIDSTVGQSFLLKDVIDSSYQKVTGATGIVKSNYYSLLSDDQPIDGCGSLRVLTNGGSLRAATGDKFPFTTTIKDILTSLKAMDCAGVGYEWDAAGEKELVRIEPVSYFFQDVEIMQIDSNYDYQEEVAKNYIYNQVEVGYEKYNEKDENSLDEAHAYHEYQTPIKTEANKYTAKSKFIGSAYIIETTRRAQFSEDENQATSYDDDIFWIDVDRSESETWEVAILGLTGNPTRALLSFPSEPIKLLVGMVITIEGAKYKVVSGGKIGFRYVYVTDALIPVIPQIPSQAYPAATVYFSDYTPVADEPFSSVENLLDPSTAYNLIRTPKRMLFEHSSWLLSCLIYKGNSELIKNTFVKQNGDLQTTMRSDYECPGADVLQLPLQEKADVAVSDFGYGTPIFSPEYVTFKTRMSKEKVRFLINCHRGLNPDGKNYGYVTYFNEEGVECRGWVYEIESNLLTEEVTLKLLKKKMS